MITSRADQKFKQKIFLKVFGARIYSTLAAGEALTPEVSHAAAIEALDVLEVLDTLDSIEPLLQRAGLIETRLQHEPLPPTREQLHRALDDEASAKDAPEES